ncbi:MAG: hypothetical protein HZC42_12070 [Candidatus Eisenbacteria bacterium]|nr:hypothetical protein [Candidatus Eisenbacteria bacterium]
MPPRSSVLAAACAALLASAAALAAPAVPVLAPDRLQPGQKAIVRTVFRGDSIEEVPAEIVGVLKGGRAEGDMILARATSERLEKIGVAQGMSGSPVYVDGKLIGALSSGWSFAREPLFGITPIGEMLPVLELASSARAAGSAGPSGVELAGPDGARFRELRWDDGPDDQAAVPPGRVRAPAREDGPGVPGPIPLMLPLACSGLSPAALEPVRRWLAPLGLAVVPGGRAAGGGPPPDALRPGAAVAVDVMRGDVEMAAIGTLTYRAGDRVLLFGHPFFQSGEVRLPLSTAEIATVVSNQASSFKLGVRGREAGVVTQDRRTAVAGTIGGVARMLPVRVTVAGAGRQRQDFRFETVEDRALAPSLVGVATLNSVLESGGSGGNQTLRWTLALHRPGAAPLVLTDLVAGDSPPAEVVGGIAAPLRFLFNNPFARLPLDSVAVAVEVRAGRELWTLRSARLLDAAVRPGGQVRVECELERWRGGRETRRFTVAVPEEAPDGRYVLWLGGGAELSRYEAGKLPARYRPTSLDDAWRRLASSRPADALYAALFARAPEVTSDGRDYPELPVSALALLSSGQAAGDLARRGDTARLEETRQPLDGLTRGELLLSITVDSRAP